MAGGALQTVATEAAAKPQPRLRLNAWRNWLEPGRLVLVVVTVLLFTVLTRRVGDPDFWWHLRVAQWMVDNQALPSHDVFTYTVPDHRWLDHEYLTELLMYGLYRIGGFAAVSIAFAAVTWAGFLLILRRTRLEGTPALLSAVVLGIAALAGAAIWGPRSQMITFALTCLELYWIEAFLRGRSRAIYALPAVVVLWANLHAGFVFSLFFLALAAACETVLWWLRRDPQNRFRATRLTAVFGLCLAAGLLTPHGVDLYAYVVKTQLSGIQQSFIVEWHSPDFHRLDARGLEVLIVLLAVGFALRRPRLWDVALAVAGIVLALQAVRHTAIFVAAVAPILAWSYSEAWSAFAPVMRLRRLAAERAEEVRMALVGLLAVTVVFTGLFVRTTLRGQAASTDANFPVGAADWLAQHPTVGSRVFNAYDWGGYLAYRFYPQENRRIFSFGEAVVMGDPLMTEISDVENSKPNWQDILQRHGVDYVVERPDSPLAMALSVAPGWTKTYDDGFALIFTKH